MNNSIITQNKAIELFKSNKRIVNKIKAVGLMKDIVHHTNDKNHLKRLRIDNTNYINANGFQYYAVVERIIRIDKKK